MIEFADVQAAAARLAGHLVDTPFLPSRVLSSITGAHIWIKFENHQFTAAFKERGALNRLLCLTPAERAAGVCAMSAGNHAQALAYHAARLGIAATIFMPEGSPLTKVENTAAHGAEVVLTGATLAEARQAALDTATARGLTFVHPYDDDLVMAGQGTMAMEMLRDVPDLDCLVIPIGGGGLIAGCATVARALAHNLRVYGVQTELFSAAASLLHPEARIGAAGPTIAEGIAVAQPGTLTSEVIRARVDDVLVVREADIEQAIALFLNIEKTVAEGAGAAGLAAVLANPELFRGKRVGLTLCGGNIDMRLLAGVIMRQLVRDQRIITTRIALPDQPGALGRLTTLAGESGANIVDLRHERTVLGVPAKQAVVEITFECRDAGHAEAVLSQLHGAGFVAPQ
jgi:threonine dehydratase